MLLLCRRRCADVISLTGAAFSALQGVGCTPWAPVSLPLCRCDFRGRRSIWCSPRSRMPWAPVSPPRPRACTLLWRALPTGPEAATQEPHTVHPIPWRAPNAAPATDITHAQQRRHRSLPRKSHRHTAAVTLGWWQFVGERLLWCHLVGDTSLLAIGWWQLVGGSWLVVIGW